MSVGNESNVRVFSYFKAMLGRLNAVLSTEVKKRQTTALKSGILSNFSIIMLRLNHVTTTDIIRKA